jgi:hypothetical protein
LTRPRRMTAETVPSIQELVPGFKPESHLERRWVAEPRGAQEACLGPPSGRPSGSARWAACGCQPQPHRRLQEAVFFGSAVPCPAA